MAITQKLLNLDGYFRSTTGAKIILNDLNYFSLDDKEIINKNLMMIYDNTDVMSVKPACDCGKTHGKYLLGRYCPHCGTMCQEPTQKVNPILWMKAIDEDHLFLNPMMWLMLKKLLSKDIDYMRYLCDSRYNLPIEIPPYVIGIRDNILGGVRNYANTMKHLKEIVIYLMSVSKFKSKHTDLMLLIDMIDEHPEDLFSHYLPIVNKKLFVVENTTKGKFINLAAADIIDVVINWVKLCSEEHNLQPKQISSTMATVMCNITNLYYNYFSNILVTKSGIFRKHVYGTRSHFTFRCVIISVPGEHVYDEITVPWAIGITAFRPHLLNKLMRRGYSYKHANNLLFRGVKSYDPVLSELLDELIAETPGGRGIKCLMLRNPSLLIGSSMLMRITKFNKDPDNYGVRVSQQIIKNCNGDLPIRSAS